MEGFLAFGAPFATSGEAADEGEASAALVVVDEGDAPSFFEVARLTTSMTPQSSPRNPRVPPSTAAT